ncbi:MAG: tRNA lysidine(34) synthetase TilS, partial [Balneolales bacterium]
MNKSESGKLLVEAVESSLKRHELNHKNPLFILGVSGGPDSMVLTHLFSKLGKKAVVAHVNYQKRPEADSDEELVRSYSKSISCDKFNFKCEVKQSDYRNAIGNFQNWAREERRTFFRDLKVKYKASAIITGHHKDDQLETLIQKVMRGSSLSTWSGISEFDGMYLRPLLNVYKASIIEFAEHYSIPYSIDASNLESTYARNFIRNEWKPELHRLFPGWEKNILRLTERAGEYQEMLDLILEQVSTGDAGLHRARFLNLKKDVRKAVILEKSRQLYPGDKISTSALVNLGLDNLKTGQVAQISSNISVIRDREVFTLSKITPDDAYFFTLNLKDLENNPIIKDDYKFSIQTFIKPDFKKKVYLNLEKLSPQITLRSWQPGDRFRPFGLDGTKKISDYLTDKKIDPSKKNKAGVVVSFDENICAVIFPCTGKINRIGASDERVR